MSEIDWVTKLFACSPTRVFEDLKLQVKKDIDIRNALLPKGSGYGFEMVVSSGDRFVVLIHLGPKRMQTVEFTLADTGISVGNGTKLMFDATLTLDDEGECVPKINGREYQFWQMRKMALQDLFHEV
ncbi:MAG: hypothetical protein ACLQOO_18000 [Terriglobia bacterium]